MARASLTTFAPALAHRRAALGLTRKELAVLAGTHEDSLIKLERGDRQPSLELAYRLAVALGCRVDDFTPPYPRENKSRKPGE